jgi:Carboxypeptidase regulatory-like domain/TonB dependent receptor
MNRSFTILLSVILFIALGSTSVWAQAVSTSQITGTVKDQTGAVLPGAEVTATQTDTGAKRTVVSDETGSYILANLPIGPYRLEVGLTGFRTYVQTGIVLQVGSNPTIPVVLAVGQVSEQVEVAADAALVETRSTGVGQVIDNQRVLELPLNGRQATELIFLSGMATPSLGAGLNSKVRNYPTTEVVIAGGLSNGMTYLLDGATHNDAYNNLNLPLPFPDALQEFKVETSALPAQYGHHSAAAINGVTKAGTNDIHGDVFEFLRNGVFNARNTFAATRDNLKRNQFGGTIGGPIIKNRLFFFGGEQVTIIRSTPDQTTEFIPTAQMLSGDFTTITSPQCNTTGQVLLKEKFADGTPTGFISNRINPSLLSPVSLAILKQPGFPTTSDSCGRVKIGRKAGSDEYLTVGRVDYNLSDKHSLFGRYLSAVYNQPSDFDPQNLLALSNAELRFRVHSFALGDTYLIGNGTVSSFRGTVYRSKIPKSSPRYFDANDVGINVYVAVPRFMRFTVNNSFSIAGSGATPSTYNTTGFQLAEDMSMIRGAHQIGYGISWIHGELNGVSQLNATAPFTFNGQLTGLGLADFMIGRASMLTQGSPSLGYFRLNYLGLYLQDAWKATSRLTVNAGLRWEPTLPAYSKNGYFVHFDPAAFAQGKKSTVYINAPTGLTFPGDPGYPGNSAGNKRWSNFAPRVGLAWDPKGDGRMSVRAAYGIFYDLPSLNYYIGFAQSPPFGNNVTYQNPPSFADPWQGFPGGNPFPRVLTRDSNFVTFGAYETMPFNPKSTYSQQWNLSLERQIGTNWLVSGNYVGTSIIHLWAGNQINPAVFLGLDACTLPGSATRSTVCSTTGNINNRRKLNLQDPVQGQFFGSIQQLDDGGTGSYEGIVLSVQRRQAKGLTVQTNYTLAHCISDLADPELAVAGQPSTIPDNRRYDRGNCPTSDRRHVFNISTVYQTPQFAGSAMRMLASGWQVTGIVRLRSGPYLSVISGLDQALSGTMNQRAVQLLRDPYLPNKSIDHYLNPAAFTQPAVGTYSSLGANNVLAPGLVQIDMGLTRSFQVRERESLQFRAEAFNLPNHVNLSPTDWTNPAAPSTGFNMRNSPSFGRFLSAYDPRILQFALKYVF